jgi:hypothetical protein
MVMNGAAKNNTMSLKTSEGLLGAGVAAAWCGAAEDRPFFPGTIPVPGISCGSLILAPSLVPASSFDARVACRVIDADQLYLALQSCGTIIVKEGKPMGSHNPDE